MRDAPKVQPFHLLMNRILDTSMPSAAAKPLSHDVQEIVGKMLE